MTNICDRPRNGGGDNALLKGTRVGERLCCECSGLECLSTTGHIDDCGIYTIPRRSGHQTNNFHPASFVYKRQLWARYANATSRAGQAPLTQSPHMCIALTSKKPRWYGRAPCCRSDWSYCVV